MRNGPRTVDNTMTLLGDFGRVFARAFHSSPIACAKHSKRRLEHILRNVPKYPYPIKHTFKQSWFGLYGGKHIQFGNNVPKNFLRFKTRRRWLPNVRHRSVYSRALGTHFSLDITASVLRMSLHEIEEGRHVRILINNIGKLRHDRQSWWT